MIKYLKFKGICFLLLLIPMIVMGGTAPPEEERLLQPQVSLEDLIDYALKYNPGWKATQLEIDQAREKVNQVQGWDNPKFKVTQFGENIETKSGPQQRVLSFSQRLPFWGEIRLGEKAEEAKLLATLQKTEDKKLNLETAVRVSYYDLWNLEQTRLFLVENQRVIEQLSTLGSADLSHQTGALRSVMKAQAQAGQNAYDLLIVEERLISQKVRLNTLLGRGEASLITNVLPPGIPEFEGKLEELILRTNKNHPTILALQAKIEAARQGFDLASNRKFAPNVEVGINYFDIGTNEGSTSADNGKDAYNFSIGINIPFGSTRLSAKQEISRLELEKTQLQKEQKENDLRSEVTGYYYQVINAQRLSKLFKGSLLPQAQRSYAEAERLFRTKQQQAVAVLETLNILINFRISAVKASSDFLKALAKLEYLTGKL